MVNYTKITLIVFLLFLFSKIANSMSSSSYLIANKAIAEFDYETASNFFKNQKNDYLNILEQRKQIVSFINSNKLDKAVVIANQIKKLDIYNEDAWLVLYTSATLNKDLIIIKNFDILINNNEFKILNYVFYNNGKLNNNNEDIAYKLFNLIQNTDLLNLDYPKNIDYYFFYLNLALILNPNFNEALYLKGQIYQELKFFIKAEKVFNKINKQHSLYIEAQKSIALSKKYTNKFYESEKLLIKLMNEYPNNDSIIMLLADLYQTNKNYDKAINLFAVLIENKAINNDALWLIYYKIGICYEKSNKWEKAKINFLKALKIEPNQPQVLNYLAYGWIEKNINIEKSIKMLEIAIKKKPSSHYILDSLAWAHYKKNNFLKAVEMMEDVIEIAPAEAISLDHLGDIYFSLGRKREAYFMWTQALDLAEPEDNISKKILIKIEKYNAG